MKKLIFPILAVLVLVPAGMAFAQAPDTVPPGPTQQVRPGLTNNNLPNPGNPIPPPTTTTTTTAPQPAEPTTTATEPVPAQADQEATPNNYNAAAASPYPSSSHDVPKTTETTTTTTTAPMSDSTTGDTSSATDANGGTLPATGSEMPLLGLVGLLSLVGAAAVRRS